MNEPQKIEIIEVTLGVDPHEDPKLELGDTKERIRKLVAVADAKQQERQLKAETRSRQEELWFQRCNSLFTAFFREDGIATFESKWILKYLRLDPKDLGPLVQRFKRFLRKEKGSEWVLTIKGRPKKYTLTRFGAPSNSSPEHT